MKKMLFISELPAKSENYFYGSSFVEIFTVSGYRVTAMNCQPFKEKFYNYFFVNALFLIKLFYNRPNLVFLLKAESINYRLLKYCKKWLNFKLYNFYPDSPFAFFNCNSNANILLTLPFYDKFFIWNKAFFSALASGGCKKIGYFPFFPDLEKLRKPREVRSEMCFDVCFVGSWDKKRADLLESIVSRIPEIKLGLFGNLWRENLSSQSPLFKHLHPKTIGVGAMQEVFYSSKISLNILKQQNEGSHNMRSFEIAASGGLMLAEFSQEQEDFFTSGKEAFFFKDKQGLIETINFLQQNPEHRKMAKQAAYEKVQQYSLKKHLQSLDL